MPDALKIAVLVGSLRRESYSRRIAEAMIELAPETLDCGIVEIGDLPLYNEDFDGDPPAAWTRFRGEIAAARAVLFVTPEYNRSIPGCLKNAIDVGSRPGGKSVWKGLPAGVVSDTPYKLGAFGANHALRQTFVFLDMPAMQQPEAYIGKVADLIDDAGKVTGKDGRKLLGDFMTAFAAWAARLAGGAGVGDDGFAAFMETREAASNAWIAGDPEPLRPLLAGHDPASFFGPDGGVTTGAEAVAKAYDKGAAAFAPGSTGHFEILQQASGDLGFWTGYQHAEVRMKGKDAPVTMKLRITEVFRRESGGWKLIHRHADMGKREEGDRT